LAENGAVSLWIPLHRMGLQELRAIVGSFVDAFENAELYLIHNDVVMLGGGRGGKRTTADRLALFRAGWTNEVAADMAKARIFSPEELATLVVAGPDALARFVAGARRNRDDDPWIEFSLPLYVHRDTRGENLEALLALRDSAEAVSPRSVAFAATQRNYLAPSAGQGLEILRTGLVDGESPLVEHRMAVRESAGELALQLWRAGNGCKARVLAQAEAVHPQATIESLLSAEEVLHAEADWIAVAQVTARLKAGWPDRAEGFLWAGDALARQARFEEAIPDLERAAALDSFGGFSLSLLRALGRAYMLTGREELGRAVLTNLLARDPSQKDMATLLKASPENLAVMRQDLEADARGRVRNLEFVDHPF